MKNRVLQFCRLNPSFIICLGLLNGILPVLCLRDIAPIILLFSALCFSTVFLLISRKVFAKSAIFTIIGWLILFFALSPEKSNYINKLPAGNCGGIIEVRICDPTTPGKKIEWLPMPSSVKAEVLQMRYSPVDKWQKTSGRIALRFPRKTSGVFFGDILRLEGAFIEPDQAVFKGGFDYKKYLLSKGIHKLFTVSEFQVLSSASDSGSLWVRSQRNILRVRDYFMGGMGEGMEIKYKRMMAAILFGCRQGLNYSSRRQFMQSGVIHIFAISGLHVGMLALTLYLIFCWVPFRVRHLLIPCFLFIYVFTTGMQASAMRAFLMISIWSLHRTALRSMSPLNAVFLAAVIVLIWNPLTVLGAGFQYSFTIAGFLILSWQSVKKWFAYFGERHLWDPQYNTGVVFQLHRLRNTSLNSLLCSFIAWLSGSGLNLLHRNFFIPGAVFANFIIIPFLWLLFVVASLEVIIFPLRHFFRIGVVMELLLKSIDGLSFVGAVTGGGLYLSSPPYWLLIVFFAALAVLVTASKKRTFFIAVAIIILNVAYWHFQDDFFPEEKKITIIHGDDSQEPAFICVPPNRTGVTIVNAGSAKRAKVMLEFLARQGINSVDTLSFSRSGKESCNGAWIILSGINVRHVILPVNFRKSYYAKSAMNAAVKSGAYIDVMQNDSEYADTGFSIRKLKDRGFAFDVDVPELQVKAVVREDNPGEKKVTLIENGDEWLLDLLNSNIMQFYNR